MGEKEQSMNWVAIVYKLSRSFICVFLILAACPKTFAQTPAELFAKSYSNFKSINTLVFNASYKNNGKNALKNVDVEGRFGLKKGDFDLQKFKSFAMVMIAGRIFFEEVVFNGTTFYTYNNDEGSYENKGGLYTEYNGKIMTRTSAFVFTNLISWFQEFEVNKNLITAAMDSNGYQLKIPVSKTRGEVIMYYVNGGKLPYKVIEYSLGDDLNDYSELTISGLHENMVFPAYYFEVPRKVVHENTTTALSDTVLLPVGSMAPEWSLISSTGEMRKLSDFRGKVVVLDFWATWCGPCLKAIPTLQYIHENYQNVAVIGMNDLEKVDLNAFKIKKGITYEIILASAQTIKDYKIGAIPTAYVLDKAGKIIYTARGYSEEERDALMAVVEKIAK